MLYALELTVMVVWRIARQRLRKHAPTRNNRESCVFYVVCITQQYGGLCFLCVVRAEVL
jgi:hypothetical protein